MCCRLVLRKRRLDSLKTPTHAQLQPVYVDVVKTQPRVHLHIDTDPAEQKGLAGAEITKPITLGNEQQWSFVQKMPWPHAQGDLPTLTL